MTPAFKDENPHRPAWICRKVFIIVVRRITSHWPSPPPELVTLRRTAQRAGALVLVAEDQPPLFQIVGRHFYRHAIAG
jgi:hypothetical protein